MWSGVLFSIILTRLWASIGVTHSYSSRPFLCALVYHYTRDSKDLETFGSPVYSVFAGFKSELKESFETVKECRLKSTRKESSEIYIFAKDYTPSSWVQLVLLPKLSPLQFLSLSVVAGGVWVWCGCCMWNVFCCALLHAADEAWHWPQRVLCNGWLYVTPKPILFQGDGLFMHTAGPIRLHT